MSIHKVIQRLFYPPRGLDRPSIYADKQRAMIRADVGLFASRDARTEDAAQIIK